MLASVVRFQDQGKRSRRVLDHHVSRRAIVENEMSGPVVDSEEVVEEFPDRGYKVVKQIYRFDPTCDQQEMMIARSLEDDGYIGMDTDAEKYWKELGITRFLKGGHGDVCCVGLCPEKNKWYGWSHRAAGGYAPGETVEDDAIVSGCFGKNSSPYQKGYVCKDLDDSFEMAKVYASEVG